MGFAADLVATLVGAGAGFALAMWWDRRRSHAELQQRRHRVAQALGRELEAIEGGLQEVKFATVPMPDGVGVDMKLPCLPEAAFEAAVASGDLTLLAPAAQAELSTFYEQLRIPRLLADQVATSAGRGFGTAEDELTFWGNAFGHMAGYCEMLRDRVPDVRAALAAG